MRVQHVGAVFLILANALCVPACAQTQATHDIDKISSEIVSKELELIKLTSNLRLHMIPHAWSQRRWFAYNLNNYALTAAGAFMNGCGRFSYFHTHRIKRAPKYLFANAALIRSFANMISCGGCIVEYGFDRFYDHRDRRHDVDLGTMRRYADRLQSDIDGLLVKRDAIISAGAAIDEQTKNIITEESELLRGVRNAALSDFTRSFAEAKGNRVTKYISLVITFLSNFNAGTGALVGEHSTIEKGGTPRSRTRLGGASGICDLISSSANTVNPLLQEAGAYVTRRCQRRKISQLLECQENVNLGELQTHAARYESLLASRPQLEVKGEILKKAIFDKEVAVLVSHDVSRRKGVWSHKKNVAENMVPATLTGGAKFTNGVGTATGSFWYTSKAQKRFDAIGAGALTYGIGYSTAAAELIRHQIAVEYADYRSRKRGTSWRGNLTKEIAELDDLSLQATKLP